MVNKRSFFGGHPSYFRQEIIPVLRIFETRRKRILRKIIKIQFFIALLITALVIFLSFQPINLFTAHEFFAFYLPVSVFFLLTVFFFTYRQLAKEYKEEFKQQVITAIVNFFASTLQYDPHGWVSESQYLQSGLFKTPHHSYGGDDRVFGTLGKTRIEFSEVVAIYRGSQSSTINFYGLFFVADFNKQIKGTTVVLPPDVDRTTINFYRHLELITLEDPAFEKYFVVYGDDQNEARYILTPNLMERIVSFRERTGQKIRLSFWGEKVYVAIPSGYNMFEPRVYSTIWSKTLIKRYVDDMAMALGVVEELNLNRRIWTKV